ncbi:helix-turn-helix transcriptional regulator [Sphingobacterium shayense]|uniref:helix-turn-helix domain-containing protein n=1 Tax=Sphingobacterium shayense TaxID=626343 RepID=UPI001554AF91|nr:helix-turn-helix domain-containing protein [Sphingobacterium shayense]NQD72095.1 helix-turn-helix transcriptional regulator [Sphingobacterium shayense]
MKKTIYFPGRLYVKNMVEQTQLQSLVSSFKMLNSKRTNLKIETAECVIQEFDGRYAYLYSFEIILPHSQTFLMQSKFSDLHKLYLLDAIKPVHITSGKRWGHHLALAPNYGCFAYLPDGCYRVRLPKGKTHLFGYYFDNKIFRRENERKFEFIKTVIDAQRTRMNIPKFSEIIPIDSRTTMFIQNLCENINQKELQGEAFIFQGIVRLIELARDNYNEHYSRESYEHSIADRARQLVEDHVDQYGNAFSFNSIYEILGYKKTTVHRVHQCKFHGSLLDYKKELLLQKAMKLLERGESIKNCAYSCGYNSPENFHRFFKGRAGFSPSVYVKNLQERNDQR